MARTSEQREFAHRRFDELRDDLSRRELSNTEAYDKAIFAVSSTFLGVSVAGFKILVQPIDAHHLWMMLLSWALLALVIPVSLFSFIVSNRGIAVLRDASRRYYIDEIEKALQSPNGYVKLNKGMNITAGIGLTLAVLLAVSFIIINVKEQANSMSIKPDFTHTGETTRSANVPSMEPVPQRPEPGGSTNIPTLESIPAPKPVPPGESK